MTRWLLFVLLVLAVPLGATWVANGRPPPERALGTLLRETRALVRTRPAPPPTAEPQPEPEPEPAGEPDGPDGSDPEERDPEGPAEPAPPPDAAGDEARTAFLAGRFDEAARHWAGRDDDAHALARLGAAFRDAFPARETDAPYAVVTTRTGAEFEGFVRDHEGLVSIEGFGGRSQSLPRDSIARRTVLDPQAARARVATRVREEASDPGLRGVRLFALLAEACAADRPDIVAPLLDDLLALDEEDPFFLSSVRRRAPAGAQHALYRAFAACQVPHADSGPRPVAPREPVTVERGPEDGGGGIDRTNPLVGSRTERRLEGGVSRGGDVTDERVLALLREAAPKRKRAQEMYRELYAQEATAVDTGEIDDAVRLLEESITIYQRAMEIEDSDTVYALIRHCSRLAFQLRFLKQQAEAR